MNIEVSTDVYISEWVLREDCVDCLTNLVKDYSSIFLWTVESKEEGSTVDERNAETHIWSIGMLIFLESGAGKASLT